MDEEDFESLLDAAFGIENVQDKCSEPPAGGACEEPQQGTAAAEHSSQHHPSSNSLQPSPAASPVHTSPEWLPAGSPCWSGASMQMHASPPHDHHSAAAEQHNPQLLYSPVRQGSPSPAEQSSPVFRNGVPHTAVLHTAEQRQHHQQQQAEHAQEQQSHKQQQAPVRRQQHQHSHSLCGLPREVQMRVLCFLSADSLTSLTQTCSQLRGMCNEPVLWRRLFVHRWGKNVRHSNTQSWKVRYMERDAAELEAAGAGAQGRDVMQDIFLQAHRAKRHKALGIGAVDDLMLVEDDEVAARVLAWRKSRGFVTQTHRPDSDAQPQRPADLALPTGLNHHQGSDQRAAAGFSGYSSGRPRGVIRRTGLVPDASSGGGAGCCGKAAAEAVGAVGAAGAAVPGTCMHPLTATPPQAAPLGDGLPAAARLSEHSSGTAAAAAQHSQATAGPSLPAPAPAAAAAQPPTVKTVAAGTAAASGGGGAGSSGQGLPKGAAGSGSGSSSSSSSRRRAMRRRQPRRWTQIGNVFCDEQTGWVHVCDETCSEKIVERSSGLLVCPISGTCSERLLTCIEEDEEEGDRDPDKEHREEDFGGERGRLARAFAAGYYCSDERELLRECGVYLPH